MAKILISQAKDKLKFWCLLAIIVGCVCYIYKQELLRAVLYYPYYREYKTDTDQFKILLVWGTGIGEREHMQRLKIAAARIGITLRPVSDLTHELKYDQYIKKKSLIAAKAFKPDLVFILERGLEPVPGYKNYAWIDQSLSSARAWDYSRYDGVLPIFTNYAEVPKDYKVYFNWYPTSYKTDYVAQIPQKLFYPGGVINDNTRSTDKYLQVFSMLDKTGYFEVYGSKERWKHTPNSFKGGLPFDGISILKVANVAGVSLVLHARDHLESGLPTGRIFEAAAANTVVISDQNKFVQDNFGDNVLYIDVSKDAPEMFAQIDAHMRWILANPDKAQQMAERCHEIITEKFTFEDQLQQLVDLHKSLTVNG